MKRIWKCQYEFYEFTDPRITWFTGQCYSSSFIRSCAFKVLCRKKQHMYCFLFPSSNFINFVTNPCARYSRFIGAKMCVEVCFGSFVSIHTNLRSIKGAQLGVQRLVLGNQTFPVQVRLLAMCRGELSAIIARLMPKCP